MYSQHREGHTPQARTSGGFNLIKHTSTDLIRKRYNQYWIDCLLAGLSLVQWIGMLGAPFLLVLQTSIAHPTILELDGFHNIDTASDSNATSSAIRFQGLETSSTALQHDQDTLLGWKNHFLQQDQSSNATEWLSSWIETDNSPCAWKGIVCQEWNSETRVSIINMPAVLLKGTLPTEGYGNLTGLLELRLAHNLLNGSIPAGIASAANLRVLDLTDNLLTGQIPSDLGVLESLRVLNLSSNSLSSSIPPAIFLKCSSLKAVNFSVNNFNDSVPYMGNCRNLEALQLRQNQLGGTIPAELGNLPNLIELDLGDNKFTGHIDQQLFASCRSLEILQVGGCELSGSIPEEIGNCLNLLTLNLQNNNLSGQIPNQVGNISKLRCLALGNNSLSGSVPHELGTCRNLSILDLSTNLFSGGIPPSFIRLQALEYLALQGNNFTGSFPTSLTNLTNLRSLDLSTNRFEGTVPKEVSELVNLQFFYLAYNNFSGQIPSEIGSLLNLQVLDFSHNHLTGTIPPSLGNLKRLLWLQLCKNKLSGSIPNELGNCESLVWLNLQDNHFSGEVPSAVGNIGAEAEDTFALNQQTLRQLPCDLGECSALERWLPGQYAPYSYLIADFQQDNHRCRSWWNLLLKGELHPANSKGTRFPYFQLSYNQLNGSIPSNIGRSGQFTILLLDNNLFSGPIPDTLDNLPLYSLNLSHNRLNGSIPETLGLASTLMSIDLSYNNLSGTFPSSLDNLTFLDAWNVSYNNLSGPVPSAHQFNTFRSDSYIGNPYACFAQDPFGATGNLDLPLCLTLAPSPSPVLSSFKQQGGGSKDLTPGAIVGISISTTLLALGIAALGCWTSNKIKQHRKAMAGDETGNSKFERVGKDRLLSSQDVLNIPVSSFGTNSLPRALAYIDLLVATNNFDEANVIGDGGFGIVYKAKLSDGQVVAIKKLHQDGAQGAREFAAEMLTLGNIRHDNLVPLLGCCASEGEKLLVYKCISNGSLDEWLHDRAGGNELLDWSKRLNIALGAAKGLTFLHHQCCPVIIHRDMKASNILLDESFNAFVTDFGLARQMFGQDTHVSTIVAGTLGYVPPEYSQTWRSTTKGDVYSFGVVLLELATGKRPTGVDFGERYVGGNLVEWVSILLSTSRHEDAIDPVLSRQATDPELLQFIKLGVLCTENLPSNRPPMCDVVKALEQIQTSVRIGRHAMNISAQC